MYCKLFITGIKQILFNGSEMTSLQVTGVEAMENIIACSVYCSMIVFKSLLFLNSSSGYLLYSSNVIFQPLSAVLIFSAGVNCCIPVLLISSPTQLFWDYQQRINILFQYLLVFSSPCKLFCFFFVFQLEVTVISKHNYFLASLGWSEFSCLS